MYPRPGWSRLIEREWAGRSVVWLMGVRRVGKTILAGSLPGIEYFDCELPSVRRSLEDPERFLEGVAGKTVVLDEVHRLPNPSELLKIAADHFPRTRVLATGSSTLGASRRFRDTLAGRKTEVWLTPMTLEDQAAFGNDDLERRMLHGGLPSLFLEKQPEERAYDEWMDAFWAKDVQELFRLERRHSFRRFMELLMAQSGGIFEATRFAGPCEVSRTTIASYLSVLESTFVVHLVRPFSTRRSAEIVSAPRVYGFDTGFVCAFRGWRTLRREDLGVLWEHIVLNELHARLQSRRIHYWRSKHGNEIDFVIPGRAGETVAIECKWSEDDFTPRSLQVFRRSYPRGRSFVVCPRVDRSRDGTWGGITASFVNATMLLDHLARIHPA
jgi:predicted AAA+ superfamily ATPase